MCPINATLWISTNVLIHWFIRKRYHPILPFCFFAIKVSPEEFKTFILRKKGVIPLPQTLGEHLRNRRLVLDLRQEDVARQLGTLREVYERWERDERQPVVSEWPSILSFLGYYPGAENTPADWVLKARRILGLSQYAIGRMVKAIAKDVREWEHGESEPPASKQERIKAIAMSPLVVANAV